MAFIDTPGLKASVTVSESVVESEDLDGSHATQSVQVAGWELLWGSSMFVPHQRSNERRCEHIPQTFGQAHNLGRSKRVE